MSRWWRAYDEAVDDPKLQQLPPALSWSWFNLCCITSQNGGNLPSIEAIAFKLRSTPAKTKRVIASLVQAGLIDIDVEGQRPHNWNARQFKSDVTDPTNAKRQKRYRERNRNGPNTVTVTPTRADTETESERKEGTADAVPILSDYAFESGIIRLNDKHFNQWKQSFSYLDVPAELLAMTEWAGDQGPKRWFSAVANLLAKRNRAAKILQEKQQQQPFKWNGLEGVT